MEKSRWQQIDRPYVVLVSLFCVILIMTNLLGLKIFKAPFGDLALTSGILTYPLTFILSDLVTEIYGRSKANFMIYLGFGLSLLMYFIVKVISNLPPHRYWIIEDNPFGYVNLTDYQNAFSATFQITGTLIFASMLAYMTAQVTDVYLFQKIKQLTKGKHLWLRNNASTMISQLIDTVIVCSIVLYSGLHMEFVVGLELMMGVYLYKLILSVLSTPILYGLIKLLKPKDSFVKTPCARDEF